jgi:hypothetical protein
VVSTLPNGLTLIVQPEDVSDTVSVFGLIRNRPEVQAPPRSRKASQPARPAFLWQRARWTAGLSARAGWHRCRERMPAPISLEVLSQDFDRGGQLLADNELHPALPPQALEVMRPQVRRWSPRATQSGYLAQRSLRESLFPKDDPSLRESDPAERAALTIDQVRAYHAATFRPDLTTIVVIGKITPEQARPRSRNTSAPGAPPARRPTSTCRRCRRTAAAQHRGAGRQPRVQDQVVLAQNLDLNAQRSRLLRARSSAARCWAAVSIPRAVSIDLRKEAVPWLVAVAFFMESLDTTILNTAVPAIAKALARGPAEHEVGAGQLHAEPGGVHSDQRLDGGPLRHAPGVRVRHRALHAGLVPVRHFEQHPSAGRVPHPAGLRRRHDGAGGPADLVRTFAKSELIRAMSFVAIPG